ncbi:MAG TPA: hypothetical protein VLT58_11435, partial [Polyangia bacterium]|nr:hypothetical protein [Polyangia bacterium]
IHPRTSSTGTGGGTGSDAGPPDNGLALSALALSPGHQDVALSLDAASGTLTATAMFTAAGTTAAGATQDVTTRVSWAGSSPAIAVTAGLVTVTQPGTFTVTARSGSVMATATVTATYSGSLNAPGFSGGSGDFAGAPSGSTSIVYPSAGTIFPANLTPPTVHLSRAANQTEAKLSFSGTGLKLDYLANCEAGWPGTGCYVTLPPALLPLLVAASSDTDIQVTASVAAPGGANLAAAPAIAVAWADVPLEGGLYYWTTITGATAGYKPPAGATSGTAVQRYNLSKGMSAPELIWTDQGAPPAFGGSPSAKANDAPTDGNSAWGEPTCIGCHTITNDGKTMAFSIGGSGPSDLALLDLSTRTLALLDPAATATTAALTPLAKDRKSDFATLIAFNNDGSQMVNMYRGHFYLRGAIWTPGQTTPLTFAPNAPLTFSAPGADALTDPFWSFDGRLFAFTSYDPAAVSLRNGDFKNGGRVWMATSDGAAIHDDAVPLAPAEAGMTHYNPAISSDGQLVVFNRSSCSGPATPGSYGTDPCDGYDDPSATLWLTTPAAGAPVALNAADGPPNSDDSWPRWSPNVGTFRGRPLYWVAFSSRRPYGLQINQSGLSGSKPQLWISAVLAGEQTAADPSHPSFWLPNQNANQASPTGNHVPQWVKVAIPID